MQRAVDDDRTGAALRLRRLPRVLHDSPACVLLLDLSDDAVVQANPAGRDLVPGRRLPAGVADWVSAADLRRTDGTAYDPGDDPVSRIAAGEAVAGVVRAPVGAAQVGGAHPVGDAGRQPPPRDEVAAGGVGLHHRVVGQVEQQDAGGAVVQDAGEPAQPQGRPGAVVVDRPLHCTRPCEARTASSGGRWSGRGHPGEPTGAEPSR